MKNLVIVESPAKAKTISKYLGSGFNVLSSVGHIRSIAKKAKKDLPPIDTHNGYKTIYEVDPDKKKIISNLKKAVAMSDTVWLATDEDREGEAIAWHLCEVLKLDPKTTKRIVFHEITKNAIEEAVKNPRTIDMQLVEAQQARQILDRLVGFELSPVVWRKVPGGKSAGRVQSPAVRLLVEREREIDAFSSSFDFKITAEFKHGSDLVKAELSERFKTEAEANALLNRLIDSSFLVDNVSKSPASRNPSAPFTTSTLQQEANARLGFSAKATMASAQRLYQEGKITYMRTDSFNLSNQSIAAMAEYITDNFGPDYSTVRKYKTKSASAQEAHEAIRPTDIKLERASDNEYDQKLYDLIRRRTLASQMSPAKLEKTVITIKITRSSENTILQSNLQPKFDKASGPLLEPGEKPALQDSIFTTTGYFEAKGEVVLFPGFLKIYGNRKDDEILPAINSGDTLELNSANARQMFMRPPARYSEGSLVKKLEELGIGRPSTYATILNTIQVRGYAEKGESEGLPRDFISLTLKDNSVNKEVLSEKTGSDKGKLVPTPTGEVVSDFLTSHFEQIIDYGFTASVETSFDKIATGSLARNIMLDDFYIPFHKLIENSGDIDRSVVAKARQVGIDPKTNKPILARFGRFGPMLQLGETGDSSDKPQFAPMPSGKKIETITLEEALEAFKLPRLVGKTPEGLDIKANVGRFGPYIQIDKLFISIKAYDPHTITAEDALALYHEKLRLEAEKNISTFDDGIKVLNGRYGPYITDGSKNAKIPKSFSDPSKITHQQAKEILASAPESKKKRFIKRAKSSKKSKK